MSTTNRTQYRGKKYPSVIGTCRVTPKEIFKVTEPIQQKSLFSGAQMNLNEDAFAVDVRDVTAPESSNIVHREPIVYNQIQQPAGSLPNHYGRERNSSGNVSGTCSTPEDETLPLVKNLSTEICPQTEIRKLGVYFTNFLSHLLDAGNDWEILMSEIRQDFFNLDDENKRYTAEDIREIRSTCEIGESCTEIFLDEWGTSGDERPTLQLLHSYLKMAGLVRAANELTVQFPTLQRTEPSEMSPPKFVHYEALEKATKNFDREQLLGEGKFASFYLIKWNGLDRVIKKLIHDGHQQLEKEMLLSKINHPRLLRLIAISNDRVPCLVHPYMPHGSLKDRLTGTVREASLLPLRWWSRVLIANHIIEGLSYLHSLPQPIVHRYMKSSNIFLDSADVPHIGDFGFIHCEGRSSLELQDKNAYMAPEVFLPTCIKKLDIYSYGVILLDLLTGSLTFDKKESYLKEHAKRAVKTRNGNMEDLLDGEWPSDIANQLCAIAADCLENESGKRPNSYEVKNLVENFLKHHEITRGVYND